MCAIISAWHFGPNEQSECISKFCVFVLLAVNLYADTFVALTRRRLRKRK